MDLLIHVCFRVRYSQEMQLYILFTDCFSQEQAVWNEYVWRGTTNWHMYIEMYAKV